MSGLPLSDRDPHTEPACGYLLQVEPVFHERVWGREDLRPIYSRPAERPQRVGEVWLTGDQNRVTNGRWAGTSLGEVARACAPGLLGSAGSAPRPGFPVFPLLVKFLFTNDKLSVQVHPPDSYAREKEGSAGKTEMWHVLAADPGAQLAVGFRDDLTSGAMWHREALRTAVRSGAIEQMLRWVDVRAGDTFFVPAGTVHAIGGGIGLCEIQQNSDVTYRLYDYNRPGTDGRPRPLHVEKSLDVLEWRSRGGRTRPLELAQDHATRLCLAACPYFATEQWLLEGAFEHTTGARGEIWIALEGAAEFRVAQEPVQCKQGEVVIVPADVDRFAVRSPHPSVFLRTYPPDLGADVIAPLEARGF
ncbi:MAG TPA: class I mannose-6-phosphate isomerase, partial [Anaerolineales bacterium]